MCARRRRQLARHVGELPRDGARVASTTSSAAMRNGASRSSRTGSTWSTIQTTASSSHAPDLCRRRRSASDRRPPRSKCRPGRDRLGSAPARRQLRAVRHRVAGADSWEREGCGPRRHAGGRGARATDSARARVRL